MDKPFIITPQAQQDFDKTFWWYEEQYQGLGKEFARCVDAKIAEIQRFPEQFQIIYKDKVRRALVPRFPYSVFSSISQKYSVYLPFSAKAETLIFGNPVYKE